MHVDSPVQVHAAYPARFERTELLLRVIILLTLLLVGVQAWPFALLYFALPIAAAVLRSIHEPARFVAEDAPRLVRFVTWTTGVLAYFALVTDRLPGTRQPTVDVQIVPGVAPTVASALARLVLAVPSAIVLALLTCFSALLGFCAAVVVLFNGHVPHSIWSLQLAMVRWHTRLFAYLASVVDAYPPFALDTAEPHATDGTAVA